MKPERTNVTYNNITGNGQGGIILRCKKSATHIIEYNNVTENYGTGIWIGGPNNTIRYNTITNNKNGSAYTGIVGLLASMVLGLKYADTRQITTRYFQTLCVEMTVWI
jgi:parallel beta-helix repeat protein